MLLIDDDDIVNSINSVIIKHAKFAGDVQAINTVSDAIDFLSSTKGSDESPDIVFLDLNMPDQNGWDFIEEYEKLEISQEVKVIMLTSSISTKDEERAAESDCITAFISKPLSPELLDSIYESHLEKN